MPPIQKRLIHTSPSLAWSPGDVPVWNPDLYGAGKGGWDKSSPGGGGLPLGHKLTHQLGGSDELDLSQYRGTNGRSAFLCPTSREWSYTSTPPTAGTAYILRFFASYRAPITLGAIVVQTAATAGSTDPVEIAVYNSALTAKLATTGVDSSGLLATSGVRTLPLVWTPPAVGVYYVVFGAGTITGAPTLSAATFSSNENRRIMGASVGSVETYSKASVWSSGLPADLSAGVGAVASAPVVALRES